MNITKAEVDSFTEVLFQKYGLDFTCYEPQSLQRRINRVLHVFKCSSIHELWIMMLRDRRLIYKFMDEISVGLTSMFRDPNVWSELKKILSRFPKEKFDIWSAGCSTGEEVYTLAILLTDLGLLDNVNVFASDMNQTAMEVAKAGRYHKVKMIEYEKNYKQYSLFGNFSKYYTAEEKHIVMNKDLLKNVRFNYHNLITDPFLGSYDFIFIRNVLIYFDQKSKDRLLSQFYDSLKPGGYLILGYYDSMLPVEHKSKFNTDLSTFRIFRKEETPSFQHI